LPAVPSPGEPYDEPLHALWQREVALLPAGVVWFDAHTHMGDNDPDGRTATAQEILAGLDRAGQQGALIFPTQEPDGYPRYNDAAIAAAAASGGRLVALARLDPKAGDVLAEARRCLQAGAAGFKLHPRSDAFSVEHPNVEAIVALAAEHRAPVLFHAGRGFDGLGDAAVTLARRHPDARIILAHAGISDLARLHDVLPELPNIFFDTSWWQVGDLLALYSSVPPGRILYASDMPYGSPLFASFAFLRCARRVGLGDDALCSIAGGQMLRILAREDTIDLGYAPGFQTIAERDLDAERAISYLTAACQALFRGHDATESLALARLPLLNGAHAESDRLVRQAQERHLGQGSDRLAAAYPAMTAQLLLGTVV
jgi:uncharacterized protein